jgi:protein SCO1/2
VLTPDGRLRDTCSASVRPARSPALVEASAGTLGTAVDTLLLYCYHYDPMTGRYGLNHARAARGGALTVALLGVRHVMVRRERRLS